jgi:cell filamentation protein, protein adenylyltransferase
VRGLAGRPGENASCVRNFILEELADALDDRSGQFRYYFILSSGRVEPYAADDPNALECSTRNDALLVRPLSHAEAHQVIRDFIETLADGEFAERLHAAASGPSPARFLQVIGAYPRARRSWLSYRQRRLEVLALDWLRMQEVDLSRLGLDDALRSEEEAIGLRFDPALEPKMAELGERVKAFWRRGAAVRAATSAERMVLHLDEIYHSNAMRGNRLDRTQTEVVVLRGETVGGLTLREHLEAVNLHRALHHAETVAKSQAPLTEHTIRELHRQLFAAIDDENGGAYRRIDTRVVGRDYLPPESVLVPALLREFTEWLDESTAHPVSKATAAQAKIQNLSPFLDGNGRVGRLLSSTILFATGYPPAIVRTEDAARYYEGLRQADAGDLSGLLALTIDGVSESLARLEAAAS